MHVIKLLEGIHSELHYLNKDVIKKYSELVSFIIDETKSMKEVYLTLTDKCFNKKEVIDLISSSDLQIILNNTKVGRVVLDFWNGPYETEFFMNNSMAYQQFYSMFIDSKKFLDYKPENKYRYSISRLFTKKQRGPKEVKKLNKPTKMAHFFHFERWDKSIITKYIVEAMMIITIVENWYRKATITLEHNWAAVKAWEPIMGIVNDLHKLDRGSNEYKTLVAQNEGQLQSWELHCKEYLESINATLIVSFF